MAAARPHCVPELRVTAARHFPQRKQRSSPRVDASDACRASTRICDAPLALGYRRECLCCPTAKGVVYGIPFPFHTTPLFRLSILGSRRQQQQRVETRGGGAMSSL
eukprot:scaffold206461_cov30-Tisochrysis_lutea.AAC.3